MLKRKKKVTNVWLMGGFGNVLFQILAYRVLKSEGYIVYYVDKLTKRNIYTTLLNWTIHEQLYGEFIEENEIRNVNSIKSVNAIIFAILSKILKISFKTSLFYSDKLKFTDKDVKNFFGYFQEKKYLTQNRDFLLDLGKDIYRSHFINNPYKCVVHYRKGDSDWAEKYHHYYSEVRERMKNLQEEQFILVVTDSLSDASDFFGGIENVKIIRSEKAIIDFQYLVSAEKLFCAPSTFSWWAAHSLEKNAEVVFPRMLEEKLGIYCNVAKITIVD